MNRNTQRTRTRCRSRRWGLPLLPLALFLASPGHAATVLLSVWVSSAINEQDGTTPLADGSVIHIVGSASDGLNNGFPSMGTNLVSNVAMPDDTILHTTVIDSTYFGEDGRFFAQFYYDDTLYDHFYLRAFDSSLYPYPTGLVYWGSSSVLAAPDAPLGEADLVFASFNTSTENNFVAVPEPGTAQLILLFMGGALAYRAARSRGRVRLSELLASASPAAAASPPPRDWL